MILDTNVLLYHLQGRPPVTDLLERLERLGEPLRISVVTRIEVLGHPRVAGPLDATVRRFLDAFAVVPLTDPVVERTIALRRSTRLKLPDAIIAAAALTVGETLVTHDRRGFRTVPDLRLLDPLPSPDDDPSTARDRAVAYRPSASGGVGRSSSPPASAARARRGGPKSACASSKRPPASRKAKH